VEANVEEDGTGSRLTYAEEEGVERRRAEMVGGRGEQKWWEGDGGREFYGEKRGGRERWEDDMRERDEAQRGGEEVGGGGRWRGGRERRYQWIMVVRV